MPSCFYDYVWNDQWCFQRHYVKLIWLQFQEPYLATASGRHSMPRVLMATSLWWNQRNTGACAQGAVYPRTITLDVRRTFWITWMSAAPEDSHASSRYLTRSCLMYSRAGRTWSRTLKQSTIVFQVSTCKQSYSSLWYGQIMFKQV